LPIVCQDREQRAKAACKVLREIHSPCAVSDEPPLEDVGQVWDGLLFRPAIVVQLMRQDLRKPRERPGSVWQRGSGEGQGCELGNPVVVGRAVARRVAMEVVGVGPQALTMAQHNQRWDAAGDGVGAGPQHVTPGLAVGRPPALDP